MCGLFAVINKKNQNIDYNKFKKSLNLMQARGPDWTIFKKIKNNIYFGQNVLSMTGNNTNSSKIFTSKSKRYFIIFNGEIYNYKNLKNLSGLSDHPSPTDTEILVNLIEKFGLKKTIKLIDGMFVFLIFDYISNSLYYARDPQGEKSLYVLEDANNIIFSSEIISIKNYISKIELVPSVLETYFYTRHFIQTKNTIFKSISIIPKGYLNKINLNNFKTSNICKFENYDLVKRETYNYFKKESLDYHINYLENIIIENLKEMLPDNRRFTSIVSGGIDSTLISFYLRMMSSPDKYLALNHINNDIITNNLNSFQKYFDNKIQIIDVEPVDYIFYLNKIYENYLSPIHTHSFVGQYMVSLHSKKNGCKALFGGEAVDELFGGYAVYSKNHKNNKINNSDYSKITNLNIFKKNEYKEVFIKDNNDNWNKSFNTFSFIKNLDERNKQAMMLNDLNYQVSTVGVRGSDLMGMTNSIEQRSVFLRKKIIEYALNLPIEYKINKENQSRNMQSKFIIKKIFEKYFDKKLIYKKQGFSGFPNNLDNFLGSKKNYVVRDILNFKNYDNFINNLNTKSLWKLNNTELFLRYFYSS